MIALPASQGLLSIFYLVTVNVYTKYHGEPMLPRSFHRIKADHKGMLSTNTHTHMLTSSNSWYIAYLYIFKTYGITTSYLDYASQ
jgi:hypothetical protein